MLILGIKPGHDGGIAILRDNKLLFSLESEKDSHRRYTGLTPETLLDAARLCDELPDIVALGGWYRRESLDYSIGAGYLGNVAHSLPQDFFGKRISFFTSSHERSHIMTALGLAPASGHELRTILVWEGYTGSFFLVDDKTQIIHTVPVLTQPGVRYSMLFALADPSVPDSGRHQRFEDSGKLMALAGFGRPEDADSDIIATVDRLLEPSALLPMPKEELRKTSLYNVGVTSQSVKTAAALLTKRIFDKFAHAAGRELPAGTPLYISGGCGLNCDWNGLWRESAHFSSVFVPPCTNDSGSAIGTAIDALFHATGRYQIDWTVFSGLRFEEDILPPAQRWARHVLDVRSLATALATGRVVAWVQGRWEIGPRALGHRSLLAEPFNAATRDRLNEIKKREGYRPIAPCCRIEDAAELFDSSFPDPYMLYFRKVTSPRLGAVTHVDGTARVQTVSRQDDPLLHDLLSEFATQRGVGVLCNTSLNFNGYGFINRLSDLIEYCEERDIDDIVVGSKWYIRQRLHQEDEIRER
jgi:hydroxymethyl cephem carbamoyltransferase